MPSKTEIVLQDFDEWMIRWKHYQTVEDWKIEKQAQWNRRRNYAITGVFGGCVSLYTAGPATISRIFGPPHFFDMGFDAAMKDTLREFLNSRRRFTPHGYLRILSIVGPSMLLLAGLQHYSEKSRLDAYLKQSTVFGEQARRFTATGKLEEFLCVNLKATLSEKEQVIYGDVAH